MREKYEVFLKNCEKNMTGKIKTMKNISSAVDILTNEKNPKNKGDNNVVYSRQVTRGNKSYLIKIIFCELQLLKQKSI